MCSKRILIFLILIISISQAYAQRSGYGVGIIIGEPTGLSGKYWMDKETAVSAGLAYSFASNNRGISLHADLINHQYGVIKSGYILPVYYGFGFRLRTKERTDGSFGVRGVVGLNWQRTDYPIDIFIEAAPVFILLPETGVAIDASLGARYFFK